MSLKKVLELSDFIDDNSISEYLLESKIIQLVDTVKFFEVYNPSFIIKDFLKYNYSIIFLQGNFIAVLFCTKNQELGSLLSNPSISEISKKEAISEFWVVIINESFNETEILFNHEDPNFIYFDKVFTFNFFKQSIAQVK